MPSNNGSVSRWLGDLQAGDPSAAQQLWQRYFRRLVGLARLKLRGAPRRAAGEEDVALSALDSFCRNARQGRFPQLLDRDNLWRLLVVITVRKAHHLARDATRQKRGGEQSASDPAGDVNEATVLEQVLSREPTPDLAAQFAEEYHALLNRLDDAELKTIALLRMEGYSVEEIAKKLGFVARSIKRKLQLIRSIWKEAIEP
jgi:DNA-directed RNA polymerase specialized sigma24 family protein